MSETPQRDALVARIGELQQEWRDLVAEVGPDRMTEPGPMGEWSFKDLAAHLYGWRERTLERLEAQADDRPVGPPPWPEELDDDDVINDWIHDRGMRQTTDEALAEVDASYDRLAAALGRLPESVLTDPRGIDWLDGEAATDIDWVSHLHEEHMPSIRAWLDGQR